MINFRSTDKIDKIDKIEKFRSDNGEDMKMESKKQDKTGDRQKINQERQWNQDNYFNRNSVYVDRQLIK